MQVRTTRNSRDSKTAEVGLGEGIGRKLSEITICTIWKNVIETYNISYQSCCK